MRAIAFLALLPGMCCMAQPDSAEVNENAGTQFAVPLFNTGSESESQQESQDVSALLQSSKDVFTQFSAFQFGSSRYRVRGYQGSERTILMNGVDMSSPETGGAGWGSWGGMNDVTRFTEIRTGLSANRYGFGAPGGYVNIDSRPSSFKKSTRATVSVGNRAYAARAMVTYATGISETGWAFCISASSRYGEQVNIPGTYLRAASFYAAADKIISRRSSVGAQFMLAPIEQGRASAVTKEVAALTGNPYYNSNWGYQAAKVRNSRVSRSCLPTFLITHMYEKDNTARWTSSAMFTTGSESMTGLQSGHAPDYRPDYYKNLPSYFLSLGDSAGAQTAADSWRTQPPQIDWDRMIALNEANLYSDPNTLGQHRNTTETRARYILANFVQRRMQATINSTYNRRIGRYFISGGVNATAYRSRKYEVAEDLLGASFWVDVDQFAEGLGTDQQIIQNDIDRPDRKVRTGEKFGYDYAISVNRLNGWTQAEHSGKWLDSYAAINSTVLQTWRTGFVANGKFPSDSRGNSGKPLFFGAGARSGVTVKFNGRNYITANALVQSRPPQPGQLFISPRTRNDIIPATNEAIFSGDVSYHIKSPVLRARITAYYTTMKNQLWTRSYWDDAYNTTVNLVMTGVNQCYRGVEAGIEKVVNISHVLQAAAGYGEFYYAGRPMLQGWQDNSAVQLFSSRTAYIDHYRVGGAPQCVAGAGYRYNSPKRWYAGVNVNGFTSNYVEINPLRRTAEYSGKFLDSEISQATAITAQERLPAYCIVNAIAGKQWRLKKRRGLGAQLSVNNMLNSRGIASTGFEQLRFDPVFPNRFANKYYYLPGLNVMSNINFSF